ncbi:hypothetical protein Thermo_00118 [Thermoplasmatales archaeon]|nr:hypothetical protein Thermo_00118 [Thermoplasmatales archaeon]
MEHHHNMQGQEADCFRSNILAYISISRRELASNNWNDLNGGLVDISLKLNIENITMHRKCSAKIMLISMKFEI